MYFAKLQERYKRCEKFVPAAGFLGGVLFDIVTLGRIDSWANIAQQAVYLVLIAWLIALEMKESAGRFQPGALLSRFWKYRDAGVHFLLGSLLSAYAIFYFKSSSFLNSLVFITLMAGILIFNEFQHFRNLGVTIRSVLFTLCLVSFFLCVVPLALGFIGIVPFLTSIGLTLVFILVYVRFLSLKASEMRVVAAQVRAPALGVCLTFTLLYFLGMIPPVPLSVSFMGVYHGVSKENGRYILTYTRPKWKVWQTGDQSYAYREGDLLYGFVRVFSPSRFKDKVQVRWLLKEKKRGWQTQDVIPMEIVGGRDEGYRGYTVKKAFSPGKWRFQVETTDGREVGRYYFVVFADPTRGDREMKTEIQ